MKIYTVGHSTRSLDEFVGVLTAHGVRLLCDVRSRPGSRRHPHFARESLERALPEYVWLGRELGGLRKSYEEHMRSEEFDKGIGRLVYLAEQQPVAVMCAERDWRDCHRRFLSDHLTAVLGFKVIHILDRIAAEVHTRSREARVVEGRLRYDLDESGTPPLF